MSTAFRTPLIDPVRNFLAAWLPVRDPLFSLRRYRSLLRTCVDLCRLESKALVELVGILDPKILGKGWWFRFWSSRVKSRIFLNNVSSDAPMVDPLELMNARTEYAKVKEAVADLSRVMGSVFFKFPKVYLSTVEARGLERFKTRLESHSPWNWGKLEIRCDGNGREYSNFCKLRQIRALILSSYHNTFNTSIEFHSAILAVLKRRQIFAKAAGFESWTEMQQITNGIEKKNLDEIFLQGKSAAKVEISKIKREFKKEYPSETIDTTDEGYLLTPQMGGSIAPSQAFEYMRVVRESMGEIGDFFGVKIEPCDAKKWHLGWHPNVLVFAVKSDTLLGHIYLDLFRRSFSSLAGSGPHCTMLSEGHVRISMGLVPPYRSDVTFKKERYLTVEEITALWHEMGHAMHVLLRPKGSPISKLPLDMREAVSVFCEMKYLSKHPFSRSKFFYFDIIRNIAVCDFLHSTQFDPFTASVEDLKAESRRVFAQYTVVGELAPWCNPLGGELSNYLLHGESRTGYLLAYIRAAWYKGDFEKFNADFFQAKFAPIQFRSKDLLGEPNSRALWIN